MISAFDDLYYMNRAFREAQLAYNEGEVPIGAIVVCKGSIIATAHNLTERLTDVTAHAEMQAITAAARHLGGKYLIDCTLYVTLEPCTMCAGALYLSQLSKLVFAATDSLRGYQARKVLLHPKTEVVSGVLQQESAELLQSFFTKKRTR